MSMRERRSAKRIDQRHVALVEGVEHRHGRERGYPCRVPAPGEAVGSKKGERIGAVSIATRHGSRREFAHAETGSKAAAGGSASCRRNGGNRDRLPPARHSIMPWNRIARRRRKA